MHEYCQKITLIFRRHCEETHTKYHWKTWYSV